MKGDTPFDSLVKLGELEDYEDKQQAQQTAAAAAHASAGAASTKAGRGEVLRTQPNRTTHELSIRCTFTDSIRLQILELFLQPRASARHLHMHMHPHSAAECVPSAAYNI